MSEADAAAWSAAGTKVETTDGAVWMRVVAAASPTPGRDPLLVLHGFPTSSWDFAEAVLIRND